MRILVRSAVLLLHCTLAFFRSHEEQAIVELALRQQLAVYAQDRPRPRISQFDRAFWVMLSRLWPRWKDQLVIVRPETVVRWHRQGFRKYWRSISTPGSGRPPISKARQHLHVVDLLALAQVAQVCHEGARRQVENGDPAEGVLAPGQCQVAEGVALADLAGAAEEVVAVCSGS